MEDRKITTPAGTIRFVAPRSTTTLPSGMVNGNDFRPSPRTPKATTSFMADALQAENDDIQKRRPATFEK